jgi:hypothetical protein
VPVLPSFLPRVVPSKNVPHNSFELHPLARVTISEPMFRMKDEAGLINQVLCRTKAMDTRCEEASLCHVGSRAAAPSPLRRGKWTSEEEAYVSQVIHDFNAGHLDAPAGTTLRS